MGQGPGTKMNSLGLNQLPQCIYKFMHCWMNSRNIHVLCLKLYIYNEEANVQFYKQRVQAISPAFKALVKLCTFSAQIQFLS